jgi:hypothetical protein
MTRTRTRTKSLDNLALVISGSPARHLPRGTRPWPSPARASLFRPPFADLSNFSLPGHVPRLFEMVAPLRRTNSLAPGSRPSNFFLELVLRSRPSKRALSLTGTSGLSVDSKSGLLPW